MKHSLLWRLRQIYGFGVHTVSTFSNVIFSVTTVVTSNLNIWTASTPRDLTGGSVQKVLNSRVMKKQNFFSKTEVGQKL